jgi:uncharacterized protein YcbK (DUF882 family)
MNRRAFLLGSLAAATLSSWDTTFAQEVNRVHRVSKSLVAGNGRLLLKRQSTGEGIDLAYRQHGQLDRKALAEFSWFWRDVKYDDTAVWIDPRLLDFVFNVQSTMSMIHGSSLPFILTSGFRTPKHNAALEIEGAAKNSEHVKGRAGDFEVVGYPARAIGIAGLVFKGGGVGFYPNFTHLDVGNFRCWPQACRKLGEKNYGE